MKMHDRLAPSCFVVPLVLFQDVSREGRGGGLGQREPPNHEWICARFPPLRHQGQRVAKELRLLVRGCVGIGDAALQHLQQRLHQRTTMCVGGRDDVVLQLNRQALARLRGEKRLVVVPNATHLFEEPGALDQVAQLARDWFVAHLV